MDGLLYRTDGLPYRGSFGAERPAGLSHLALPPEPMPSHAGLRPLKAWRYVGVFGPELMLCLGVVRVGRLSQSFWGVWDREERRLHERTAIGSGRVRLSPGRAEVRCRDVEISLELEEGPGVETVSRSGPSYAWTRKQGGVAARGIVALAGRRHEVHAGAVIDDSAGYHQRHTQWRWCAGVGRSVEGRAVAWNLVEGVHDARKGSERTVWVDGEATEPGPCTFDDLRGVAGLHFEPEAVRERTDNLLLVRSSYRQPFGLFSGTLPSDLELAEGYGVMEAHEAWW